MTQFPPAAGTPMLIVSPHLDDAALSCWTLLDRPGVEVLTAFAGRPTEPVSASHDALAGFPDSDAAMDARLAEDRAALDGFGVASRRLDLLDLAYAPLPRSADDAERLATAVQDWIAAARGAHRPVVLLPAGTGHMAGVPETATSRRGEGATQAVTARSRAKNIAGALGGRWIAHQIFLWKKSRGTARRSFAHPDHLFVRNAVLGGLLAESAVQVVLYEELPYLWSRAGEHAVAEAQSRLGFSARETALPVCRDAKAGRIGVYASQLPQLDPVGRRLEQPSSLPDRERFWVLSQDTFSKADQ